MHLTIPWWHAITSFGPLLLCCGLALTLSDHVSDRPYRTWVWTAGIIGVLAGLLLSGAWLSLHALGHVHVLAINCTP